MKSSRAVVLAVSLAALLGLGAAAWRSLPECVIGKWSGITPMDVAGNPAGPADSADWGCVGGTSATVALGIPAPGPPTDFCLYPAAPNPAVATTRLTLAVPRAGRVRLAVYAKKGNGPHNARLVRTILDRTLAPGLHEVLWDGKDDDGAPLTADLYRVVMETDDGAVCGDVELR
jgi:hypothetical protein